MLYQASYPGTPAQLAHLAVHRRAMAEWASLDSETQKLWNAYETTAEPHRPPYDHKAHISGNNLFVSAYHGFALMGEVQIPQPHPFRPFPPFAVEFLSALVEAGSLVLSVDAHLPEIPDAVFYRLYARIRLTKPGGGFGVRGMKGFLAERDGSGKMTILIPSYTEIWNIPDGAFQIQAQCILLDSRTGFRSQYQRAIQVIKASSSDLPTV